jgi:hypothetical protein
MVGLIWMAGRGGREIKRNNSALSSLAPGSQEAKRRLRSMAARIELRHNLDEAPDEARARIYLGARTAHDDSISREFFVYFTDKDGIDFSMAAPAELVRSREAEIRNFVLQFNKYWSAA